MLNAASIGMNPMDIWDMTPREFGICIEAANKKQEHEIERRKADKEDMLVQAYYIAYWGRVNRLGPNLLKKALGKEDKPASNSAEAMLEFVKRANLAFGGDVIT